ncbi:uncharacterized protein LOC121108653 isoform X2 [Gallus gallus]|uniref:uncharacterized protein LOC121108653 isoform X2 n=1 Tax=Gallus gallus TaxID=9031 RepID=UPI001AE252AF|nr:uncharacterized protein LOC121108653 isoform X2 [Gallus gallus]
MGPKTPNLGTFEVCFPPKSPPVGSPIFHWPKWVQKTQIWALLRCVSPPNPTHWISQHNWLALPSFIGQNGSKNPKLGHFWGVFSPQTPPVGSPFFPLAKMGPKTPKLGTFGVCFPPNPKHWISQHHRLGLPSFIGQNESKNPKFEHFWGVFSPQIPPVGSTFFPLAKIGQKNPKLGTFGVCFPLISPVGSPFFPLAKMGQKNPKLGTFEVCFPPKSPPVGSPIFHWPKWVQKPQNWALLRCVFPPNTASWVSHLLVGQNGSKNPKIGHFWGVFSTQTPHIGSPNTTSWLYHLSLAKMGQKNPNLGTFEGCFPPKHHHLGLLSSHWPKWVQKPQNWALLRCVFPPKTTSWVYFLPVGQNGSKNPKIGHF